MPTPKKQKNGTSTLPTAAAESPERKPARGSKAGRQVEHAEDLPRIRVLFAVFKRNQDHPRADKRFPSIKEIGALLDPERPLGEGAVRRVLTLMKADFGLPVDFVPERGGHGFTEPVAGFPLDAISEEQVYYLIQSLQALSLQRNHKAYAELRRCFRKACLGINLALGFDFQEMEKAISFHVVGFGGPAHVDPALFKAAIRAILRNKEVRLVHHSAKRPGETKVKVIHPLHVSMINHALYLWHYDPSVAAAQEKADPEGYKKLKPKQRAKKATRKFALTRIGSFEETGERFDREAYGFDIEERMANQMGAFDDVDAVPVVMRFTPKVAPFILERHWHDTQEIEQLADGGVELRLRVGCTPELEAFILRWAGEVEVVEPAGVRQRMRELGEAMWRGHGGGAG